jgi:hypothetical protein
MFTASHHLCLNGLNIPCCISSVKDLDRMRHFMLAEILMPLREVVILNVFDP